MLQRGFWIRARGEYSRERGTDLSQREKGEMDISDV